MRKEVERGRMAGNRKLICYELNEVPWRVVDKYVRAHPGGSFEYLLGKSECYTSNTIDGGELHPWTTWPTVHRGVANQQHRITSLNQDLAEADHWPPVWQLLSDAGVDVGICGSLQSYPPTTGEGIQFFIPDTFAAGPETVPERYSAFQKLNLMQTRANTATASRIGGKDVGTALGILRSGIRPSTGLKVAKHLLNERRDANFKKRRALLQPELGLDIFVDAMKRYQPSFATFFSNHVAGMMHRYWKYSFPEDFDYTLKENTVDQFHSQSVMVAMRQAEEHIDRLLKLRESHGYDLLICSSMGQAAILRDEYIPELKVVDFERLARTLKIDYNVKHNMAMHPDIALEFETREDLEHLQTVLFRLRDSSGSTLFSAPYAPKGLTLNLRTSRSAHIANDGIIMDGDRHFTSTELGLESFERDIGTGYHVPEGIVIWHRDNCAEHEPREMIDSRQILPSILQYYDVERPEYLMPSIWESSGSAIA